MLPVTVCVSKACVESRCVSLTSTSAGHLLHSRVVFVGDVGGGTGGGFVEVASLWGREGLGGSDCRDGMMVVTT